MQKDAFKRIIAALLVYANAIQTLFAAFPATTPTPLLNPNQQFGQFSALSPGNHPPAPIPQDLALSTSQFGIIGPLNGGLTYSDLTGVYFNGQFLQKINDEIGFNILGEYGNKQYRLNGTLGLILTATTLFKISAEQLAQSLPFLFSTGTVTQQVKQNAVGLRLQQDLENSNLSLGAYAANSPNERLAPIAFISNGLNCRGAPAGFTCLNERNIAGANTAGADLGLGLFVNLNTYVEGKLANPQ